MKKTATRVIIAALLCVCLLAIAAGCPGDPEPSVTSDPSTYRNFGKRFDDVTFTATAIDPVQAGTNDMAALLYILGVVDQNLISADNLASASTGGGSASSSLANLTGELQFGDIYVRENGAFYSQSVARVTSATCDISDKIVGFAQDLLDQADRKYSADGETFYVQKVAGEDATARMIVDYPYGSASFSSGELETMTLEEYMAEEYVKNDYRELSNFVFAEDTILAESISIDFADGLYTVSFEMNLDDTAARDKATEYSRANMREASSSDNLEYALYKVTLEVYENGLIRIYTKEESWEATLSLWILKPEGASHSTTSVYYSWDPLDCSFTTMGIDTSWAE